MTDLTPKLRKRLIKDFALPIQVTQDPYFEYFVELYDKDYGVRKKIEYLENASYSKSDGEFLDWYETIRNGVIDTLKTHPTYKEFIATKELDSLFPITETAPNIKMFNTRNCNKYFVSIDLKHANFTSLLSFALVADLPNPFGVNTYEEFIRSRTAVKYFVESKYTRQIIFGNLNPKRQQRVQKGIMSDALKTVKEHYPADQIFMASSDEIVIDMGTHRPMWDVVKDTLKDLHQDIARTRLFKLKQIGDLPYFVKEYTKTDVEFKAVPIHLFAQCWKHYYGLPVNENDMTFMFDNQLTRFLTPLFFGCQQ